VGWNNGKRSVARRNASSLGSQKPMARSEGLVIEELGDELLIYDLDIKHAHCLTPTAARVWKSCDGETSRDELATSLSLDADEVARALDELDTCDLITQSPVLGGNEHTRRDFGFKVAKVGAATAALPMVLSIAAPAVAATQSQIEICEILGGGFLSGECGSCNQGGSPTFCCCCHVAPGVKFCAAGDDDCQERGPTHPLWDGTPVNCTENPGDD
jgi:hypothetical protein